MKFNKPRPANIQFPLVGIMLVLGGVQHDNYPIIRNFLLLTGILLLAYSFYTLLSKKNNSFLKLFAMFGELFGLLTAAYILYHNGTDYLHYLYLLASLGIVIAIVVHFFKEVRRKSV